MRAVVFTMAGYGHLNPTLPVAAELVRRGEQVMYRVPEAFRPAVARTGASLVALEMPEVDDGPGQLDLAGIAGHNLAVTGSLLPGLLADLRSDPPDYVIHDAMCPWGAYAARRLDLPAVSLVTTFAFDGRQPARRPGARQPAAELLAARERERRFHRLARQLQREHGIRRPRVRDVFRFYGPLNLVFTSRRFQPFSQAFGDRFQFVGTAIRPEEDTDGLPGGPLLYVSLGTHVNDRPEFYRTCFRAFADLALPVLMSVGAGTDIAALGPAPPNFTLWPHVPQLAVLARAAAFVSHAGMNSVSEALFHRVPLVLLPIAGDEFWVAARAVELGAARRLDMGTVSADDLRRAVNEVLEQDDYRRASASIGDSLRTAGGAVRAAEEILRFRSTSGRRRT